MFTELFYNCKAEFFFKFLCCIQFLYIYSVSKKALITV
jgi:hypothetical protein